MGKFSQQSVVLVVVGLIAAIGVFALSVYNAYSPVCPATGQVISRDVLYATAIDHILSDQGDSWDVRYANSAEVMLRNANCCGIVDPSVRPFPEPAFGMYGRDTLLTALTVEPYLIVAVSIEAWPAQETTHYRRDVALNRCGDVVDMSWYDGVG